MGSEKADIEKNENEKSRSYFIYEVLAIIMIGLAIFFLLVLTIN